MWKSLITTLVFSWLSQTVCAEPVLQIVGETWQADSQTTCSVTLRIDSQGMEDVSLSFWQVVCQIAPSTGLPFECFLHLFARARLHARKSLRVPERIVRCLPVGRIFA